MNNYKNKVLEQAGKDMIQERLEGEQRYFFHCKRRQGIVWTFKLDE